MSTKRVYPFELVALVLAERLRGRQPSAELRAVVRSRGVDWKRVVKCASAQLVLPAFAAALQDLELTGFLEEELGAFLDAVHAANRERNGELRHELAAAVGVLNRAGVEPVLLKGAIRLVEELYPDHGWRMLRDLDLLIPEASLADAVRALRAVGYAACGPSGEMIRRAGICQIDLHTEVFGTPTQARLLRAQEIRHASRASAFGDARVRVPSVDHQTVHLIGHSQIRHHGHAFGRIGLRDRLETAALVRWGHETIDWRAVSRRFVAAGHRRPLLSWLLALNDDGWCGVPVPVGIDRLTALQRRRIALQARSTALAYIGARLGGWIDALGSELMRSDSDNIGSAIAERGAVWRTAQALRRRQRHLAHLLLCVTLLVA
jgi:hypothetical protein